MLGCGYAGEVSCDFKVFKKLITDKNYKEIKNFLDSTGLKQLLSVVVLDDLCERGLVKLTLDEKEIIAALKLSHKTYVACEGCSVYSFKGKISDIFNNKPKGVDWSNIFYEIKFRLGLVKPFDP
jgi:hypothetical protein